jgi:glucan phosphoethanolaminetransferase (alkaline phosphatase superfamily)
MGTIKKMLLIFVVNTLVMLVSWAALSLALLGVRAWMGLQSPLVTLFSINSYVIVMFCYAFYLIFDLGEYLSTETLTKRESSNAA